MKIEIDLQNILYDDDSDRSETLAESIRRQVVEMVKKEAAQDVQKQIAAAVNDTLNAELSAAIKEQMPAIVSNLMDAEFVPVGRYGERGQPTTFRAELLKSIHSEMKYLGGNRWESDKNAFTKAVDATVAAHLKTFQAEFQKTIDAEFTRGVLEQATSALKKRLGIS